MLHLRAFGSVRLIRDGGVPLEGIASQRRMLALLSILAVAGEDGVSRERIISLLWPENDSDRGRSSLSQCLYTARRLLRCDAIFRVSGDVLALNAGEITSDVSAFLGAMDAGRREEAACHFTGDFLDDFHVPGLTEFDQWLEAQRARFRNAADALFESLASAAEENAEWERAIEWRHRQSSIAPYNGRAAHRLANALRNGGNRAAALAQLRTHAALLRADLEMDPDASVVALMEELRTSPPTSGRAEEIENGVVDLPREKPPVVAVRAERRPKWHRWAVAGALNTALAAAAGGVILYGHGSSPPRQDTIVAPFRLSGADSSLRFLRDGLVEMVASRLDATGFGSLDPVIVRDAWRREGITGVSERSNRELWQVAGRVGAKRVLIGNVIGDQRHVIISTTVLDAGTEKALGVASVEGPLDSLSAMVDQLAGHLLLIDAGQVNRFSGRALPRLPALRAYLKGQAAYRIGAYLTALHDYERSLDADSNFALAALHLALTADRLDAFEQHERALTIAWSNRAQLATADRRRLVAFAGPGYPGPSLRQEQLDAIEAALRSSRDRVDVLTEIAQRYVRLGRVMGVNGAGGRAQGLLGRALQISPDDEWAQATRAFVATVRDGSDSTGSTPVDVNRLPVSLRWRLAVAAGHDAELQAIRRRFGDAGDEQLIQIARMSMFDGIASSDGERALSLWASRAGAEQDRVAIILARHAMALNENDPQRALQLTRVLAEALPGSRAHLRLRVLDALYGEGDIPAAKAAAARLRVSVARLRDSAGEAERVSRGADACVAAQWQLAQGQLDGIDAIIGYLRSAAPPRAAVTVSANPQACAALVEAWADVVRGSPRATGHLARLDSLVLSGPATGDAAAYAPILIARCYERLGDTRGALAAIERRPYLAGWPRYLSTAQREERTLRAALRDQPTGVPAVRLFGTR